jgi:hypothetical protein
LCVRFRDRAERLFQPGEHRLKTVILAASGGSVTVEAIRWCEAARVGVLIANRDNEAFSLFASSPVMTAKIKHGATALRRKQFATSALKIARLIIGQKIKSYDLDQTNRRAATASRHVCIAATLKARCVLAEVRRRWTLKVLWGHRICGGFANRRLEYSAPGQDGILQKWTLSLPRLKPRAPGRETWRPPGSTGKKANHKR